MHEIISIIFFLPQYQSEKRMKMKFLKTRIIIAKHLYLYNNFKVYTDVLKRKNQIWNELINFLL